LLMFCIVKKYFNQLLADSIDTLTKIN